MTRAAGDRAGWAHRLGRIIEGSYGVAHRLELRFHRFDGERPPVAVVKQHHDATLRLVNEWKFTGELASL